MSDFYQWFHFRLAGAAGREVTLRIVNCAGAAYPQRLARLSRLPVGSTARNGCGSPTPAMPTAC